MGSVRARGLLPCTLLPWAAHALFCAVCTACTSPLLGAQIGNQLSLPNRGVSAQPRLYTTPTPWRYGDICTVRQRDPNAASGPKDGRSGGVQQAGSKQAALHTYLKHLPCSWQGHGQGAVAAKSPPRRSRDRSRAPRVHGSLRATNEVGAELGLRRHTRVVSGQGGHSQNT